MNENKTNFESLESVILAIVMSVFILFSIYFFTILLFLVPVPFIIYGIKSDLKSSLLSLFASLLTVAIIIQPLVSTMFFLVYAPITAISIYLIRKRYKPINVVAYSAAILFITTLLLYGGLSLRGLDLVSILEDNFNQSLVQQMEILNETGLTSYELLESRDSLKSGFETVMTILPSLMFLSAFIWSYFNYQLISLGLRRIGIKIRNMTRFSKFKLPQNFVYGALIMILTSFLIRWMGVSYGDAVYLNIMILLGVVLFIQGLSVISHFLIKIKARKFMIIMTYIIIIFTPQIFQGISILGGIDVIFDIRKIKRLKS